MVCPHCGAPLNIPAAAYYTPGEYEVTCARRRRWMWQRPHKVWIVTGPFKPGV